MIARHLANQVAIVTGAGRGIGAAIADRLERDGAVTVRADLEDGDYAGDLSVETVAGALISSTITQHGKIDILVNNAGGGILRPFLDHTPETLRTTIDRNLWTAIWCSWHALRHMKTARYGRVINIGADSVRNGLVDHAGYNAAKGGVHAMTTGLAREFAPFGITVNTVAPCVVETDVVRDYRKTRPELIEQVTQIIPLGRPASESEVAGMVAYLAGPDGGFVTGQVLSLNGGTTML
jgi:2,3-dihydroxy-2,3-dihydro-p-cumate dehydrogenase